MKSLKIQQSGKRYGCEVFSRGGTYATFSKLELFYKWIQLWLYMRLWDVKRLLEIFSVLTLHRPPQISEK